MVLFAEIHRTTSKGNKVERIQLEDSLDLFYYDRGHRTDLLFIHGGPGLNSNGFQKYFTEFSASYRKLKANLIFYNQRGCSSHSDNSNNISHNTNVEDLQKIISASAKMKNNIILTAHSYGCKIAYDFLKMDPTYKTIFISPSENLLVPFLNKSQALLLLLKTFDQERYNDLFHILPHNEQIWAYTKKYEKMLSLNEDIYMWANLEKMRLYKKFSDKLNQEIFNSVSKSIDISDSKTNKLSFDNLNIPHKLFLGSQDIQMGVSSFLRNHNAVFFNKSGHYPHIEEEEKFCNEVNTFIS